MGRTWYKIMFGLIKKTFIGLMSGLVNQSNRTKCVSWSNHQFKIQPTHINLHPSKYRQEFYYYPFSVKLYRCVGSCNTLNDLSDIVCISYNKEDLNLSVCNMITGMNESKKLSKHIDLNVNVNLMEQNMI